jgi:hypothetical protein
MRRLVTALTAGLATALAGSATSQPQPTGPVATYWMSAQTSSGFVMGGMARSRRRSR